MNVPSPLGPITQYAITNKEGDIAGPFHAAGHASHFHGTWDKCSRDGACSCRMFVLTPMGA